MPTETTANADAANAVVEPIKTVPAAQTADDPNKEPSELPPWVQKRIEQAKRSGAKDAEAAARKAMLAELGIEDPDAVKKLLAEEKKRAEERKSLEQKAAERDVENANLKRERDELRESAKSFATAQMEALTEAQRNAVKELAGEDPAKQLKTIATLRATWGTVPVVPSQVPNAAAPEVPAPAQAPAVPPATKPATATAPGATAPPANGGAPVVANHLEIYERMNDPASPDYMPFRAGAYLLTHGRSIEEARKARGSN